MYHPPPPKPPPRLDLVLAQGNRLENLESTLYEDAFIVISQEEGLMFLKRKLSISFSYILLCFTLIHFRCPYIGFGITISFIENQLFT